MGALAKSLPVALMLLCMVAPERAASQVAPEPVEEGSAEEENGDDTGHDDARHDNTGHDDAGHDDAGHDNAGHDDAGHDDAGHDDDVALEEGDLGYGATATATVGPDASPRDALGQSTVSRAEMDERLPRSAPDALRYEPGVAIQQTGHGQASPYVRGMTGQQVAHLFDGVRMNNGIYRQGPNQYFFTIDASTLAAIDVIRGSASTRFGSDALGGALLATGLSPRIDPEQTFAIRPRLALSARTADRTRGARAGLELQLGRRTALMFGLGYRAVGLLETGGPVEHRDAAESPSTRDDALPWVPRYDEERTRPLVDREAYRTQLGTGFKEATFDARLEHQLSESLQLVAATYGYRQLDAPRTDQCPPPEAPLSECLTVERQFRTLSYVTLRGSVARLESLEVIVSHQRHEERRARDRPRSNVAFRWDDIVDTVGLTTRITTRSFPLAAKSVLLVRAGADAFFDLVQSSATQTFTDLDRSFTLSRGQYLEGSRYGNFGAYAEAELRHRAITARLGGRAGYVRVDAPEDTESGTQSIARGFPSAIARAGLELRAHRAVSLHLNYDQGFRAPNLDDLTSRQRAGPGFQFENPDLEAERTHALELGLRARTDAVTFEAWGFATFITNGIQRAVREADDCPLSAPECSAARDQFQLVNAEEASRIFGTEAALTWYLPRDLTFRSTFTFAWGDGPSLGDRGATNDRVPLSRVPPLQGTFELRYRNRPSGFFLAASLRWAAPQTRLAVSDVSDARIPRGGTPGYAVVDLRFGARFSPKIALSAVVENVSDAAYRVHGSSVGGPGVGISAQLRIGL